MYFLLKMVIFHCYVCLPEGNVHVPGLNFVIPWVTTSDGLLCLANPPLDYGFLDLYSHVQSMEYQWL